MLPDLDRLTDTIRAVARAELVPRFGRVERHFKGDGSVVTAADGASQDALQSALKSQWPAYGVLGEEMPQAAQRRALAGAAGGLWVVDPLDGTSNFAAGFPFYAVSVALLVGGRTALGVVYDPSRDECFAARAGAGAFLNGQPLPPAPPAPPLGKALAGVDLKRLAPALATRLASGPPYGSQRNLGSVALEWCWVAAGRLHLYLHGRQRLWDFAAGELVLREAGGHSITLEGEPVPGAGDRPRSAVAALDRDLFEAWRDWLGVAATVRE
jgi:myo-inositol-1(or 4)-monophosphatase